MQLGYSPNDGQAESAADGIGCPESFEAVERARSQFNRDAGTVSLHGQHPRAFKDLRCYPHVGSRGCISERIESESGLGGEGLDQTLTSYVSNQRLS
jgi:hypothetical protein